jgi:hypothetical protein
MDASCPSLPPKILVRNETDAELRPNAQTTIYMAAHGCHLSIGFWYVLLVIIESFFLAARNAIVARTFLYKVSIAIVSRSFYEKTIRRCFDTLTLVAGCLRLNERGHRMGLLSKKFGLERIKTDPAWW